MSPDIWPVMTMGIVILIAIATSNRSLRRELGERIDGVQRELGERINALSERFDALSERFDALSERLADVRERLGRVEGLLEGLRRKRAGKEQGDEKHSRALP